MRLFRPFAVCVRELFQKQTRRPTRRTLLVEQLEDRLQPSALATVVDLSEAPPHPVLGEPVTFTAVVSAVDSPKVPTGKVSFYSDDVFLGTVKIDKVDGVAQASFTINSLPAGDHLIRADYLGTNHFKPSSATLLDPVTVSTSTSLSLSSTSVVLGDTVFLNIAVTSTAGTPSFGTVDILLDGAVFTSVNLDPNGTKSFGTFFPQTGHHSVQAKFLGGSGTDPNGGIFQYDVSFSNTVALDVVAVATSTSLSVSPNPATTTDPVTLTATVQPTNSSLIPTGSVNFTDNGVPIGSATITGNGTAVFLTTFQTVGTHSIVATYPGDSVTFAASSSSPKTVTVNPTPATQLAFGSFSPSWIAGSPLTGVTVRLLDAFGALVTNADKAITLSLDLPNATGGVLSGVLTVTSVGGIASFGSLSIDKAGGYALRASATGLTSAVTPVNVTAASNQAPTLDPISTPKSVNEETQITFTATAHDDPNQALSFSLVGAPAGAAITPSGTFSWKPTEAQGIPGPAGSYTFSVQVTDNGSPPLSASQSVTIIVNEVNTPPTFTLTGSQTAQVGSPLSFTVSATDPDLPMNTLAYSILKYSLNGGLPISGSPAGATVNSTTGLFTWTPTSIQVGSYLVTLGVTDGVITQPVQMGVTITVSAAPPTVTIAATDPNASEPFGTTAANKGTFVVTRSGGSLSAALPVTLSISGTASNGVDYNLLSTVVTIPAKANSVTITVTPTRDSLTEGTESVLVAVAAGAGYLFNANAPPAEVDIADATGSIAGVKFEDVNGNGLRDTGEKGLAGWTIQLFRNGVLVDSKVTAAGGVYKFDKLQAGTYRVREVLQAGWIQTTVDPSDPDLGAGQNVTGVDFGNFQLTSIGGQVLLDKNGNARRDAGETSGLDGWTVFIDSNGDGVLNGGEQSTVSGPNGMFTFANMGPGTYRVREVVKPNWSPTFPVTSPNVAGFYSTTTQSGKPNPTLYFGNTAKVAEVRPLPGDFDASTTAGRIMIKAEYGTEYHTTTLTASPVPTYPNGRPAQTEDGTVTISAYLSQPTGVPLSALVGLTVYFEVIDPDDASPYTEDNSPFTYAVTNGRFTPGNVTGTTPGVDLEDTLPNDNRDPSKSMFGGSLSDYNRMQNHTLNVQSAITKLVTINQVQRVVAETDLFVTNRFGGDNYQVRATTISPNNKPFNDDSNLTDKSADAEIPRDCIQASGILTAWKRVYYERDSMYRVGGLLVANAPAGATQVEVSKASFQTMFQVNDTIRLLDGSPNGITGETFTITAKVVRQDPAFIPPGKFHYILTLNRPITQSYAVARMAFAGVETGNPDVDFFNTDVSRLRETFDDAYVEVMNGPNAGSGPVPRIDEQDFTGPQSQLAFTKLFFNNKNLDNYFYLVGANTPPPKTVLATTNNAHNFSFIYVGAIEDVFSVQKGFTAAELTNALRDITQHEIVHQFDVRGDGDGHDSELAWDALDRCLMDVDRIRTNANYKLGHQHLYKLRDFEGPI